MTRTLDRATFYWGSSREPLPLWITEYGYQTSPPDPFAGVQLSRQGPLTSWGEYLAYRNPRVASIAQFLLVDDKPIDGLATSRKGWITWQSGLYTRDGRPKPALAEYKAPIHVVRKGRSLRVFGAFRDGAQRLEAAGAGAVRRPTAGSSPGVSDHAGDQPARLPRARGSRGAAAAASGSSGTTRPPGATAVLARRASSQ